MTRCSQTSCTLAHRTVSGALGWPDGELSALGNRRGEVAINHRTVRWCTRLSGESSAPEPKSSAMNSSLSGNGKSIAAKIHRTVRWCTVLSGEPKAPAATGRLRDERTTRGRANGRIVTPSLKDQWSTSPSMEGNRAPGMYCSCPVVHPTVRCTTRQKARFAFQVNL
jgi:hypothetical protein